MKLAWLHFGQHKHIVGRQYNTKLSIQITRFRGLVTYLQVQVSFNNCVIEIRYIYILLTVRLEQSKPTVSTLGTERADFFNLLLLSSSLFLRFLG